MVLIKLNVNLLDKVMDISQLILALDYVLILAVEGSMKDYKKEGEGPMENTLSIWHFRACERDNFLIKIESLGQGLLSDFDSMISSRKGQMQ